MKHFLFDKRFIAPGFNAFTYRSYPGAYGFLWERRGAVRFDLSGAVPLPGGRPGFGLHLYWRSSRYNLRRDRDYDAGYFVWPEKHSPGARHRRFLAEEAREAGRRYADAFDATAHRTA